MERWRFRNDASRGPPRGGNASAHVEDGEAMGRGGESSADQNRSQFQPRRAPRIARQRQGFEGDDRAGLQSQVIQIPSPIETSGRGGRNNVPPRQRTGAVDGLDDAATDLWRPGSRAIEFIIAFEQQPPAQIRTGIRLPIFVVNLKLRGRGLLRNQAPIDDSNLNAMAALVAADGETPMTNFGNDVVMRPMTATPHQQHSQARDGLWWKFVFAPGEIFASGYFKIRVVVMHTPTADRGSGLEMDSPVQLLSVTSRLIHVYAFAPS